MTQFEHRQSAHCESGVVANLVSASGVPMSEPMAFGLSSSLIFAYLPMVKMAGMPLIAYRMLPGSIMKGSAKAMNANWQSETFSNADEGMAALDRALDAGKSVGLQTSIYWLPYVPEDMRFHFNAHNLVVSHKEGDEYVVSDPVFPELKRTDAASLKKARFVKGVMAPKGRMYQLLEAPNNINYEKAIPAAIERNRKLMKAPMVPMVGTKGIRYMGRQIQKLAKNPTKSDYLKQYLGHIVRMQEEIGTGGAGFRFIYAAFLKESAEMLNSKLLAEAGDAMTDAGDEWRRFALNATKMCRGRKDMDADALYDLLDVCAKKEQAVWDMLKGVKTAV